jgi:hypothetical protein
MAHYEISNRSPSGLTLAEALDEVKAIRAMIAEDRWVPSFETRLYDRLNGLMQRICDELIKEGCAALHED